MQTWWNLHSLQTDETQKCSTTIRTKKQLQRQSIFDTGQVSGARLEYQLRLERETVVIVRVERLDEQLRRVADVVHESTVDDEVLESYPSCWSQLRTHVVYKPHPRRHLQYGNDTNSTKHDRLAPLLWNDPVPVYFCFGRIVYDETPVIVQSQ